MKRTIIIFAILLSVAVSVGSSTDSIVLSASRLAAPTNADHYGVFRTDLWAVSAVDAIGRPMRQALAV